MAPLHERLGVKYLSPFGGAGVGASASTEHGVEEQPATHSTQRTARRTSGD
ncbi:MAG: hypothetical protein ACXVPX_06470 [Actinomycetota bacterium]